MTLTDASGAEVHPDRLYTVEEAAAVLRMRPKGVYEIPERDLPPTRVGPRRGRKLFRGRALIEYVSAGERETRRDAGERDAWRGRGQAIRGGW